MLKSLEFRRDIIAGIISSLIFLLLFQPIINGLGRVLQLFGTSFLSGLSNQIYSNAALGQRNYVDVMFFSLFASVFLGAMTGPLAVISFRNQLSKTKKEITPRVRKYLMIALVISLIALALFFSGLEL